MSRSLLADDRAIGYQLVIALFVIGAFALLYAFVGPIFDESHDMAVDRTDGTRYENYADTGIGYLVKAKQSMPFLVMIMVSVFLFGRAVFLSSRRY